MFWGLGLFLCRYFQMIYKFTMYELYPRARQKHLKKVLPACRPNIFRDVSGNQVFIFWSFIWKLILIAFPFPNSKLLSQLNCFIPHDCFYGLQIETNNTLRCYIQRGHRTVPSRDWNYTIFIMANKTIRKINPSDCNRVIILDW